MPRQVFPEDADTIHVWCSSCDADWYFDKYQNGMRGYNRREARMVWSMKQCVDCDGNLNRTVSWTRGV